MDVQSIAIVIMMQCRLDTLQAPVMMRHARQLPSIPGAFRAHVTTRLACRC